MALSCPITPVTLSDGIPDYSKNMLWFRDMRSNRNPNRQANVI